MLPYVLYIPKTTPFRLINHHRLSACTARVRSITIKTIRIDALKPINMSARLACVCVYVLEVLMTSSTTMTTRVTRVVVLAFRRRLHHIYTIVSVSQRKTRLDWARSCCSSFRRERACSLLYSIPVDVGWSIFVCVVYVNMPLPKPDRAHKNAVLSFTITATAATTTTLLMRHDTRHLIDTHREHKASVYIHVNSKNTNRAIKE